MSRKLTIATCVVVLLLALASIWQRLKPATLQVDRAEMRRISVAVGEVLAEETLKAANGPVVVVTEHDPAQPQGWTDERWDAFVRELKKYPAIRLTTEVANFQPEPGRTFMPPQLFLEILERHADAAVFVFLVDLPEWLMVSQSLPETRRIKLIAVDNLGQRLKLRYGGYFTSGILVALLGPRNQLVSNAGSSTNTPREWFDKFHQVYTPQNHESLPD